MSVNFNGSSWQISNQLTTSGYPVTFAAWVKKSSNALRAIVSSFTTGGTSRFYIGMNASGFPLASVTTDANATSAATGATAINNNEWTHVCGVFNSSTSRIVYRNGIQDGISTVSRTLLSMNSLIIGALWTSGTSSGSRWNGEIAEIVMYHRALAANEVLALCLGGPSKVNGNSLVFWDRMIDSQRKDIVGKLRYDHTGGTPTLTTEHPRV
jgi:hypothetical protein